MSKTMITATATPALEVPLEGESLGGGREWLEGVEGVELDELDGEELGIGVVVFADWEELEPVGYGVAVVLKVSI